MYRCLSDDYELLQKGDIVCQSDISVLLIYFPEDWELIESHAIKGKPTTLEMLDYLAEKEREFKKNSK